MLIDFEPKSNKFIIDCKPSENSVVMGLPDRTFRKVSRKWAAPALKRNIRYMREHMNNTSMYTPIALEVYNRPIDDGKKTISKIPHWFKFKNPPMSHQGYGIEKALDKDSFAFLFEQGLGKTYTSINLAALWRMKNEIDSVVVICPSSIKLVWEHELKEHCPVDYQTHVLMAGKYKKADRFIDSPTDFQWFIMGIESLSQGAAHEYFKKFLLSRRSLVIIDESSRIKNPGKKRTERCIKYGELAKKRVILSGTSITQGLEDLFAQYKFLDKNIIGFNSYTTFKANYCVSIPMEVARNKFVQKIVGYKNENDLLRDIMPYTLRVEKKDALDLPNKIFQNRYVEMSKQQRKLYEEMKHEMMVELNNIEYETQSVLEQTLRLMQITGGFYPHDDGFKIQPKPIPGKNPKIEELKELMDEIPGKAVIWCQFKSEIEAVADMLRSKGIKFVEFHGGKDDIEKKFAVESFRSDPEIKVFLATRAAAYGLTLVEASYSIYYSTGYSLEDYDQSQDRIHRIGQKDQCTYIHLVCPHTIDIKVLSALRNKKSVAELIYDSMKAGDL